MKRLNITTLSLSFGLHGLLLAALLVSFHHLHNFHVSGQTPIVQAYFVHATPKVSHPTTQHKTPLNLPKTHLASPFIAHHTTPQKHINTHHNATPRPKQQRLNGRTENQLISLLYHAIDAHKTYPAQAKALDQSGTTYINITLLPSGAIQAIQLARSSGYTDLDQAAIQAIKAASPLHGAAKLLKQAMQFTIPIRFDN